MNTKRRLVLLVLGLLLLPGAAHAEGHLALRGARRAQAQRARTQRPRTQRPQARAQTRLLAMPAPGTPAAAKLVPKYARNKRGIFVPRRQLFVANEKYIRSQQKWHAIRRAVGRHLKSKGVRLAPIRYQRLVREAFKRANKAFMRQGGSLGSWKIYAVEGGSADVVNAAAWTGGVITVNRPLIELAHQIARVVTHAGSQQQADRDLVALARFRQGKGEMPAALATAPRRGAKQMAKGIIAGVVMHEMGHAANGHLALAKPKLWTPGQRNRRDPKQSRKKEWQADRFSIQLGVRGGTRAPAAMAYFDYYMHLANPRLKAKGPHELVNTRSHPLDHQRYRAARGWLKKALPKSSAVARLPQLGLQL